MNTIPVTFTFDAHAVGRMRNDVTVTSVEPASGGVYELATDEGPMHGGESSAPTPLHLFTASLAGCFIEQSLAAGVQVRHELHHDGRALDVESSPTAASV